MFSSKVGTEDSDSSTPQNTRKKCKVCTEFKKVIKNQPKPHATSTPPLPPPECPPDAAELGRAGWTLLHSIAAYYPEQPAPTHKSQMTHLMSSLGGLYPCGWCATHLQDYLRKHPPEVDSRKGLCQWMCQLHNEVNSRTGKPSFDCNKVDERWREGPSDGSC